MASRKSKGEVEREKVIQNRLQELLTRMIQDDDNKYCADCDAKGPRWCSWNIGIFVCIRCAGIHRNLGVHISKVKSVNLDSWTPYQVSCMQIMGNSKGRAVYEANVPEGFRRPQTDAQLDVFIRAKYEKKKYIAREWVPTKAPEFPEGWTALIEAEKQKKDIRSIVLPSHTNANATNNKEENVKRERQSPKEKKTPKAIESVKGQTSVTSKPLESEFDLLSLSTTNSVQTQQNQQSSTTASQLQSNKSSIANDLLCLTGDSNASEFDDFVGAPTTVTNKSTPNGSQNGTPAAVTTSNTPSSSSFFDDFTSQGPDNSSTTKQTMSKDSIMALFNQKPPMMQQAPPTNPQNPNLFMNPNPNNPLGFPQQAPQQNPLNFGTMGIPQGSNLSGLSGLGNLSAGSGSNFGAMMPGLGQQFVQPVGGNVVGHGGIPNNPFLAMSQPTRSDQNSVFGNAGFPSATSTGNGANRNFLQ